MFSDRLPHLTAGDGIAAGQCRYHRWPSSPAKPSIAPVSPTLPYLVTSPVLATTPACRLDSRSVPLPASAATLRPHLLIIPLIYPSSFLLHVLPPSSSIHRLALFSWSAAGLTTAMTSATGHIFQAGPLPLSRHDLPFTLPQFLDPPQANSPCHFRCLLRPSALPSAASRYLEPSSTLSHHPKRRLTPCHCWG